MLVVADPPPEDALSIDDLDRAILIALAEADEEGMSGRNLTPYVLDRLRELTTGGSLRATLSLLRNNCFIAAQISLALSHTSKDIIPLESIRKRSSSAEIEMIGGHL